MKSVFVQVFLFFLFLSHSIDSTANSDCIRLFKSQIVTGSLSGLFHFTYDSSKPLRHKIGPGMSIAGHKNRVAFKGSRVIREDETNKDFIVGHEWTVFELSLLAGRDLSDSEVTELQRIHEIGRNEKGFDGGLATAGNYTLDQLRRKSKAFKRAFPDLDINAFSRFVRNGALGDTPEDKSDHPVKMINKKDLIGFLGDSNYFPMFRELTTQMGTDTPSASIRPVTMRLNDQGEWATDIRQFGLVKQLSTVRQLITDWKEDITYLGENAIKVTFQIRTENHIEQGKNTKRDETLTNTFTSFFMEKNGGIYQAMANEPWKLIWVEPKDGVTFTSSSYPGQTLRWSKLGQWMSPQTGVVYDNAFKLDLIGSNGKIGNGIYNLFFIFVPGQGNVYTRMEGLDTNRFVTIHSSENISLD